MIWKYQLERSGQKRGINAVSASIRPGIVTDKLNNAIATGNWGRGRVGVTQLLDRTNYLSTISHLRRIQSPLSRTQPNFEARDLHATHFGRICPSETPEGSNCGLVKNLALSAIISISVQSQEIVEKMFELGVVHFTEANDDAKKGSARVFVDGKLVGYVKNGQQLADSMRALRRSSKIDPHVGISFHKPEKEGATSRFYVNCNAGRIMRPLIIIKDAHSLLTSDILDKISKKLLSWRDLLRMGIIELIDANEEENCYITLDEKKTAKRTHLEIFSSSMLGAGASIIPYPEHNQSPRNTYESAMAKQSLGFSTPMMNTSTYVRQHLMLYPQTPIVTTKAILLGLEERPAGQNCIVAVLPFDGYNIEDAIVIGQASVDRGLGHSFIGYMMRPALQFRSNGERLWHPLGFMMFAMADCGKRFQHADLFLMSVLMHASESASCCPFFTYPTSLPSTNTRALPFLASSFASIKCTTPSSNIFSTISWRLYAD